MMKKWNRILALVLAAMMALTFMTACGGGSSTGNSLAKQQITAVNAAREKAGKSKLTENAELSKVAEKALALKVQYSSGEITSSVYEEKLNTILNETSNIKVNGKALAGAAYSAFTSSTATETFDSSNYVVSHDATYIGCAVKQQNGKYYVVAVTAK